MKIRIVFATGALVSAILFLTAAVSVSAEDIPDVKPLKFLEIKTPKDLERLSSTESTVVLDDGTAVSFSTGKAGEADPISLYSVKLARSGKLTSWNQVASDSDEWYYCAIWINPANKNPVATAAKGKGFLFYTHIYEGHITIRKAEFDSSGKTVGQHATVYQQQLLSSMHFEYLYFGIAVGPSTIALTFSTELSSDNRPDELIAEAYFMEFDFEGNPVGPGRQIPLVNGGRGYDCVVGKPAWNGVNWLIPAKLYEGASDRDHVYVFVAPSAVGYTSAASLNMTAKRVLKGKKRFYIDYLGNYFQFLPATSGKTPNAYSASSKGEILNLCVQRFKVIPEKKQKALTREFYYSILPIKGTGKKAGKVVNMAFDSWSPVLNYNDVLRSNREVLSYALPLPDGRALIAVARGACGKEKNSVQANSEVYDYTNQVSFFALDPDDGSTELLARESHDINALVSGSAPPIINVFKKTVKMVTSFYDFKKSRYLKYFTSFKP